MNHGLDDIWVAKIDHDGEIQWERTFGGSDREQLYRLITTPDGGYLITGSVGSVDGDIASVEEIQGLKDAWILKLDGFGDIQWESVLGGPGWDSASDIIPTPDGGYFCVGSLGDPPLNDPESIEYQDIWLFKLDAAGELIWESIWGGSGTDYGSDLVSSSDGGFMICGTVGSSDGDVTDNHGGTDMVLIKLNDQLAVEWTKCYGGSGNDNGIKIERTNEGGYVCIGQIENFDGDIDEAYGNMDSRVLKIDPVGNIEWQRTIGSTAADIGYDIIQLKNGGYMVVGHTWGVDVDMNGCNGGSGDGWLAELDQTGGIQWTTCLGGSHVDRFYSIRQTSNSGFALIGSTHSQDGDPAGLGYQGNGDMWLVRMTDQYNTIAGNVFVDLDVNGLMDAAEPRLQHHVVQHEGSGWIDLTDHAGEYVLHIPETGTIDLTTADFHALYTSSPLQWSIPLEGYQNNETRDFAFQADQQVNDLRIEVATNPFRPGFQATVQLDHMNRGTTVISPQIQLTTSDQIEFLSSDVPANLVAGNSVTWSSLPALDPFERGSIRATFQVDVTAQIGEVITVHAVIEPIEGDEVIHDNEVTRPIIVTASYDPNDIQVDREIIHVDSIAEDPLEYIIRFQNTGTDTAFTVSIKDQLPETLVRGSFEFVSSSHEVEIDFDNDAGILWFRHYDILLPDSNTNEPRSHGFVRYRIRPQPSLVVGDSILNQASIFFDFNAPVITNTAYTVIENTTGISDHSAAMFQMFPNPTAGQLTIRLPSSSSGTLTVLDAIGRKLLHTVVNGRDHQLDLSDQAKGIYLVTLQTDHGITTQRLVLE